MKQINSTRDEIINMLKSGEIVFAAFKEDHYGWGRGLLLHLGELGYSFRGKKYYSRVYSYGEAATTWFVEEAKLFEFQVGDICEFGGVEGVIERTDGGNVSLYPISWQSPAIGSSVDFTKDGRFSNSHTKPLLNFIRRPKKKVKKTIEIVTWVEVDEDGNAVDAYSFKPTTTCEKNKLVKSIATTEIEVEE